MKRAIAMSYCAGQNEPSRPIKRIIEVPDNVAARDKLLKQLFNDHVCEVEDDEDLIIRKGKKDDYGDVIVSDYNGDVFLFLTYIS